MPQRGRYRPRADQDQHQDIGKLRCKARQRAARLLGGQLRLSRSADLGGLRAEIAFPR